MSAPIRVLVIDDSAVMRQVISGILRHDADLQVVGSAPDPIAALEMIERLKPDVLTLDVEMPRMDGLMFLEKIMQSRPMPVVMISSLTEKGCQTTLRAMELGAVDFIEKPKVDVASGTVEKGEEILEKVKAAALARVRSLSCPSAASSGGKTVNVKRSGPMLKTTQKVVCIGASTGGTEALRELLSALPADAPGIAIVQHMPSGFTRSFADRLDGLCRIRVKEAKDGDRILQGHALLAPGGYQLAISRIGASYITRVAPGKPVNRHCPSVDVMFLSAARYIGGNAVGVILTGMGSDGAKGMSSMHQAGALTIAQNEATCVIFGMPKEAIALGGVDHVLPLEKIPEKILSLVNECSL
jgi:two-component system, chemotaxis family, protein-glutamate methylesterase/glutaminase